MKLTAELSLYPLEQDYIPIIQAFIDALGSEARVQVVPNAMSTQLCGDYDAVFDLVREVLRRSAERFGRQVLVCKFIPAELALDA